MKTLRLFSTVFVPRKATGFLAAILLFGSVCGVATAQTQVLLSERDYYARADYTPDNTWTLAQHIVYPITPMNGLSYAFPGRFWGDSASTPASKYGWARATVAGSDSQAYPIVEASYASDHLATTGTSRWCGDLFFTDEPAARLRREQTRG